jgi:cytochrome b
MGNFSPLELVFASIVVLLVLIVARALLFGRTDANGEIRGIGGWLVLAIIGLVATLVLTGFNTLIAFVFFDGLIDLFAEQGEGMLAAKISLTLSIFIAVAVLLSSAVLLFRIYKTKRKVVSMALVPLG